MLLLSFSLHVFSQALLVLLGQKIKKKKLKKVQGGQSLSQMKKVGYMAIVLEVK